MVNLKKTYAKIFSFASHRQKISYGLILFLWKLWPYSVSVEVTVVNFCKSN